MEQAFDIARYSASVDDLETLSCFLHFHEIKESPRYMHHLVVDRRVSDHPAQSALEYAVRESEVPAGKNKPRVEVPRILRIIR